MSLVRASFRKQVSDGNYGSESAECTLELDVDTRDQDEAADIATGLLAMCRRRVHAELSQSPSVAVQRGVEYRAPTPAFAELPADDDGMPF